MNAIIHYVIVVILKSNNNLNMDTGLDSIFVVSVIWMMIAAKGYNNATL